MCLALKTHSPSRHQTDCTLWLCRERCKTQPVEYANCSIFCLCFPNNKILDPSKPKEFVGDSVRFDESGRNFSKGIENTMGKGEILISLAISLFSPQNFPKTCIVANV